MGGGIFYQQCWLPLSEGLFLARIYKRTKGPGDRLRRGTSHPGPTPAQGRGEGGPSIQMK